MKKGPTSTMLPPQLSPGMGCSMQIHAYQLTERMSFDELDADAFVADSARSDRPVWIDIVDPDPDAASQWMHRLNLDQKVLDHIFDADRVAHFGPVGGAMLIEIPTLAGGGDTWKLVIRQPDLLITVHAHPLGEESELHAPDKLVLHDAKLDNLLFRLLQTVIDSDTLRVLRIRDDVDALCNDLWHRPQIIDNKDLIEAENKVVHALGCIEEQIHAVAYLQHMQPLSDDNAYIRHRLEELMAHTNLMLRIAQRIEQRADKAHAHYKTVVDEGIQRRLTTLTIISCIFLPLTLITGIYGMNFEAMPLEHWQFGFFVTVVIMLGVAFGMILYFRRRGWFD